MLECPLTTRIQKICNGGVCGWNDTYSSAIFNSCGAAAAVGDIHNVAASAKCQQKLGDNCAGVMNQQDCGAWYVPSGSAYSNCVWQNNKCTRGTEPCTSSRPPPPPPVTACEYQVQNASSCFAAAKGLPALQNVKAITTKTVTDASLPPGCTVGVASDGATATVHFNAKSDSKACCKNVDTIVGATQSLVKLQLSVPVANAKNVTITVTGPSDVCTSTQPNSLVSTISLSLSLSLSLSHSHSLS